MAGLEITLLLLLGRSVAILSCLIELFEYFFDVVIE